MLGQEINIYWVGIRLKQCSSLAVELVVNRLFSRLNRRINNTRIVRPSVELVGSIDEVVTKDAWEELPADLRMPAEPKHGT